MLRSQHLESMSGDPRLATRLPALRASLEEQQLVATAAATSILTSRITPEDKVAVRAARDSAFMALALIDAALSRIAHGRYGICRRCGGSIPIERLNVLPTAELCIDCQRRREGRNR